MLIESRHRSRVDFFHEQMPHMHRHNGNYSLSQITMDDVNLPRRMKGNEEVMAYYAYDVVSGCRIGAAYGRSKDDRLVVECFRDMFRLIAKNGWGMPAGIEVENHLMSKYKTGFLRAGEVFSFVHFCAPQNSQEKYSGTAERRCQACRGPQEPHGHRPPVRQGKWRVDRNKISDETNRTYEDKRYYTFEELVADDRADTIEWNNRPHPDQKRFPGMSRWEVLVANINPTLRPLDKVSLSYYIGEKVETSIRRNSTVRVAYSEWWLSHPSVIEQLSRTTSRSPPTTCPMRTANPRTCSSSRGTYIDKVSKTQTFNRVYAEQTDEDRAIFAEQCGKRAQFEKYIADNAPMRIGTIKRSRQPESPAEAVEMTPVAAMEEIPATAFSSIDWAKAGFNDQ